mmetsp:Transcript_5239/g.7006  ORF Transcript_5239/g.7006 Transcript_5239/m.7006 type:complete len:405 (-) Transcript_5239:363-1577(-)
MDFIANISLEESRTYENLFTIAAYLSIGWCLINVTVIPRVGAWVGKQSFWLDHAIGPQRAMLKNFGILNASDEELVEMFATTLFYGCHHSFCGVMLLPVCIFGWEDSSSFCRGLFAFGLLNDVGFDIFDEVYMFLRTFFHKKLGLRPHPLALFIVLGILHHPLSIMMSVPLIHLYADMREGHIIATSLLFAGAIGVLLSAYKFTLDVASPSGFFKFKIVAITQFVVITLSRAVVFPPMAWSAIQRIKADPAASTGFFVMTCFCVVLIALFNVMMVNDAASVVMKWFFRSAPEAKQVEDAKDGDGIAPVQKRRSSSLSVLLADGNEDAIELAEDMASLSGSYLLFSPSSTSFAPGCSGPIRSSLTSVQRRRCSSIMSVGSLAASISASITPSAVVEEEEEEKKNN